MLRWLLVLCTGCSIYPAPLHARVQAGPAAHEPMTTLVAMSPGLLQPDACDVHACAAMAAVMRMRLELEGFAVYDGELVNAELRRRTVETRGAAGDAMATSTTRVTGSTWQDAPPARRAALLRDLGVDGVVRVTVGAQPARLGYERTVRVTLTTRDGRLAWDSRCTVPAQVDAEDALERAAECALKGAALW